MANCFNHPDKNSYSKCRGCGKDYYEVCLDEGTEFYYCKNPECQKLLKEELTSQKMTGNVNCPNCESILELSEEENQTGKVHCPECEALIDFNFKPAKIFNKENYIELFTSLNQGDIGVIKSILEDASINYYVFGENFLSIRPLLEPARFFINENQIEEVKELLKDFDLNIWGASTNQY